MNLLSAETRGLTRVSNGTHSNHCPLLCGAYHFERAGRMPTPGRRPHQDRMHWVNQQTLVSERQKDGLGTPYSRPEPIQHDYPLPSGKVDSGEMERGLRV